MRPRRRLAALTLTAAALASCAGDDDAADPTGPGTTGATVTGQPAGDGAVATGGGPADGSSPPGPVAPGAVAFATVAEVEEPIDLRQRPGTSDLYVASRTGVIGRLVDGALVDEPLLDISDRTEATGERGLLSFVFDGPDRVIASYTRAGDGTSIVEAFPVTGGTADASAGVVLLEQQQPYPNHNGGYLTWGPDGFAYLGLGDGGSGGDPDRNGQNLDTWLGKLLRLDVSGDRAVAAPGNPLAGGQGRPEIWSWGLRNPWRFSFDRATGDLWIGDVGQGEVEEVDLSTVADGAGRGANFGWNRYEGDDDFFTGMDAPGAVAPLFTFRHGEDRACSVTGGFVYRGTAVPALDGAYLFTDLCWTGIRAWTFGTGIVDLGGDMGQVVSFAEDEAGELYVLSFDGTVTKLVAPP